MSDKLPDRSSTSSSDLGFWRVPDARSVAECAFKSTVVGLCVLVWIHKEGY